MSVGALLLLGGCSGRDSHQARSPELPPLHGVYAGTYPCRDCPGIDTTLWLRTDGRFFIRQQYAAVEEGEPIEAYGLGRWRMLESGNLLVLESDGPDRVFRREGPDGLLLQTESKLEHRLSRDREPESFSSSIRMAGTIRPQANGRVFEECLTGYTVPVRETGDFGRFRHQYRSVRARDGAVFVEFEGRFHWSDGGSPQSVTIDRFVTIRTDGAC